ncbi:MAG: hypothetical protein HFE39_03175 [Clostridiales bacterium]|jgi:hypothetical protein|nr:hypothetical protein [Clostridiales bacterium]
MNESQRKVKNFMNAQIDQLESGLDNLQDRDYQPNDMGNLYNGMLKHSVRFEIQHMRHLRDELIDVLQ